MNRGDTARLLAVIQAFDRRTIGDADIIAWSEVLADLEPDECVDAVRAHFAHTTAWLMPAHIRAHVERVRRDEAERLHALSLRLPPVDYDQQHAAYLEARAALRARLEATT